MGRAAPTRVVLAVKMRTLRWCAECRRDVIVILTMGRTHFLLTALLFVGCAQSPPPPPEVSLRATNGPTHRPRPISAPIDRDGDRVPDGSDACPTQPGSLRDGCPVVDTDGDGISDRFDKCPSVAEPRDGLADGDGCPIASVR